MEDYPFYAGIDVSKRQLELALLVPGRRQPERWQFSNDGQGIRRLRGRLLRHGAGLVVLEATGGLERLLARRLEESVLQVAVLNPRQVRHLARGLGQLAKTDAIDALLLAQIAEKVRPQPRPRRSVEEEALSDLVERRRQLNAMLTMELNRLSTAPPGVTSDIRALIRSLRRRLKTVEAKIEKTVKGKARFRAKSEILRSVPGVGPVLSATLIGSLPELGRASKGEIAKLVGVAPLNNDSGTRRGRMSCWGGRANVRAALYMAAVAGVRFNPALRQFYRRLRAQNRPAKVALIACMRKLLVILNAMLRDNTIWNDSATTA